MTRNDTSGGNAGNTDVDSANIIVSGENIKNPPKTSGTFKKPARTVKSNVKTTKV